MWGKCKTVCNSTSIQDAQWIWIFEIGGGSYALLLKIITTCYVGMS